MGGAHQHDHRCSAPNSCRLVGGISDIFHEKTCGAEKRLLSRQCSFARRRAGRAAGEAEDMAMVSVNAPSSAHQEGGLSPADLDFQDDVFRIKTSGYTILRGVWSAAQCAAARSRLEELRDEELVARGEAAESEIGFGTGVLYNKGEAFEGVYQAERVLRLVRHFLGEDATIMSLGDQGITGAIMAPVPPRPRHWGDESGLHNDGSVTGAYQGVGAPADERQRITSHVLYLQAIW